MATVVVMPSVLAGAAEAAISKWLVAPGDVVVPGTPVAEIETEKALVEYQAEAAGIVGRLVLAEGETGEIGDPILVLVAEGETDAAIDAVLGAAPAVPSAAAAAAVNGDEPPAPASVPAGRVFASPLVRKLAAEKGIDFTAVEGTGPNGRVTRRDLERDLAVPAPVLAPALPSQGPAPAPVVPVPVPGNPSQPATPPPAGARLIPHTPMRRAIARRLTESKASIPHFYLAAECVADELLALRARVNQTAHVKVSVNDFVIMAAAAAFADVPEANVTWADDGLIAHENVDIAIAVATEGGLLTPVLRDAGRKKLTEVARESADLARRARDRRLLQHELEGGSFAISNLGMYGTLEFSAIINPPQSAILAVGAARQQPVAADGQVTVATVIRCTLSVDHRAIDGALAARWLAAFTARMESPLGAIA
ncbi:MAG TPA: dihydrolipoamide acetyltransferase family protein [Trebonia sp.]|jgi:pyruvate dehydrogenase E2 component (dihydrolipoamide acetyltransferase)|nr:dihydrolipoamide acetyltransferase family protein [Trebonia sp.]